MKCGGVPVWGEIQLSCSPEDLIDHGFADQMASLRVQRARDRGHMNANGFRQFPEGGPLFSRHGYDNAVSVAALQLVKGACAVAP